MLNNIVAPADAHTNPDLISVLTAITQVQVAHTALLSDILKALTEEPKEAGGVALELRALGKAVADQTAAIEQLGVGISELVRVISEDADSAPSGSGKPPAS